MFPTTDPRAASNLSRIRRRSALRRQLGRGKSQTSACDDLESRKLFSVTVTQGYPGIYEVKGDGGSDDIEISVSMNDSTFTLDGITYNDVAYISVDAKNGDDTINLISADGEGSIAAGISAGAGNDSITINFDGGVWGGGGDDTMHLTDSYRGQALGDDGNDQIYIVGACVDAEVNGGEGDDLIDCSAASCGLIIKGGNGNDTIYGSEYNDQIWGDAGDDVLNGNGGNDYFYARDGSSDTIDGGAGNDILVADESIDTSNINIEQIYYS
jgi:Ca2+-binding RTX toxin-like protein